MGVVDRAPVGLLFKDGKLLGEEVDLGIKMRKRLSRVGHVILALIINKKGCAVGTPRLVLRGVPDYDEDGNDIAIQLQYSIDDYVSEVPMKVIRNKNDLSNGCSRVINKFFDDIWGKRPVVDVIIEYLNH